MKNSTIQLNNRLPYNPKLRDRTKELRKNMTVHERKLWYWFLRWFQNFFSSNCSTSTSNEGDWGGVVKELNEKILIKNQFCSEGDFGWVLSNLRIYKQRPIDNFIVDFYIPKLKLVIEIDWESHFTENWLVYDQERTAILEWLWLKIIRITNQEIDKNFENVCEKLKTKIINEFKVITKN